MFWDWQPGRVEDYSKFVIHSEVCLKFASHFEQKHFQLLEWKGSFEQSDPIFASSAGRQLVNSCAKKPSLRQFKTINDTIAGKADVKVCQ